MASELQIKQSSAAFVTMMDFLESLLEDSTPLMRRYGGYIYFIPNKSARDRWDQIIESQPEEAFKLAKFILKEGTDKYIEVNIISGYQNVALMGTTDSFIEFSFVTKEGSSVSREPVTVTYTFECNGRRQVVQEQYAPLDLNSTDNDRVRFRIDDYLLEGKNTISITVRGNNSKVSATETVIYTYQELSVSSDFNIARPIGNGDSMSFNVTAKGVSDGNAGVYVEYYLDNGVGRSSYFNQIIINEAQDGSNTKRVTIPAESIPEAPGKHTLQIRARATVGGVTRYSRVWYYEWVRSGAAGQIVTVKRLLADENLIPATSLVINCEKYVQEHIEYGFYSSNQGERYDMRWMLIPSAGGDATSVGSADLGGDIAGTEGKERFIEFMPVETGEYVLSAAVNGTKRAEYPVIVGENSSGLEEASTSDLRCRLMALGRSNDEPAEDRKVWKFGNVQAVMEGVAFDGVTGWVNNALQIIGKDCYVTIPVRPFQNMNYETEGCCVEIDYETYNMTDSDATVCKCGRCITIKGDSATLSTPTGRLSVVDRYPVGNRQKMAFNVHPKSASAQQTKLMEIINGGVTSCCVGYLDSDAFVNQEYIQIGGTDKCGIRIYSIRVYQVSLTNKQELNNQIIDSPNISQMVRDNDIYNGSAVDVEKLKDRIACLRLVGRGGTDNLNTIWDSQAKQLVHMDAYWTNPEMPDTNWHCIDMRVRSHGQSTLRNPLKSLKIWLKNDSSQSTHNTEFFYPDTAESAMLDPRWNMKRGSMPQTKFVVQCYYIDSSNCKSPVLMDVIDEAMRGAGIYTAPMKYAYSTSGKCYYEDMKRLYPDNPSAWTFPYTLRYTPDAIPCILTTQDTPDSPEKLVGIFVLMDDKKSDYLYGERSIYACPGDPFCFDHDKNMYECLWDNADTTRFEFLSNTHPIVTFKSIDTFFKPPQAFVPDDDEQEVVTTPEGGESATEDESASYDFEQAMELIYPDVDDLKGKKKWPLNYIPDNLQNPELAENKDDAHAARVWQFCKWVYDCYKAWEAGDNYVKFRAEASLHMDLQQWACYYLFIVPNGGFDNLVRNLQLTTFHRDPDTGYFIWIPMDWDNDILYGTINTGPYAYDPPVSRQTVNDKYGVAFRGAECFLWNALEAWTDFLTLCRDTMNSLNANGYTFGNVISKQEAFTSAWPKALYNESQNVKYKQMYLSNPSSNARYLSYLLGDGTTLRRWWIKKNYDYWMARLAAGDFTKNGVTVRWEGDTVGALRPTITVSYAEDTFFGWMQGDTLQIVDGGYSKEVKAGEMVSFTPTDISNSVYSTVFSASYIRTADYSALAYIIGETRFQYFYDSVTGTNLQEFNIGVREADMANGDTNKRPNVLVGLGYLTEMRKLNIQGWTSGEAIDLTAMKQLTHLYAKGSSYSNISLADSLRMEVAELPTTLTGISWRYCTFKQLSFHGVGADFNVRTAYPTELLTCTLIGMGEDDNIRQMVLSWLRARRGTEGLSLTISGLAWDNMDYDDVVLMATAFEFRENRNYQGKIRITKVGGVERTLTSEEINTLAELFNDNEKNINVFSTNSSFQIDCLSGFVVTGPSEILAGNSGRIQGAVFPLTAGGYTYRYTITKINGVPPSVNLGTNIQIYRNVTLNVNTGEVTTEETSEPTNEFEITCEAQSLTNVVTPVAFTFKVVKRTYPELLTIVGEQLIEETGVYTLDVEYTPEGINGTHVSSQWTVDGGNEYIYFVNPNTKGSASLRIGDFDEDVQLNIGYTEEYVGNGTFYAEPFTISVIANANEPIVESEKNYDVFSILLAFGRENPLYAPSDLSMFKRKEVYKYTYLPPQFQDETLASRVTHFAEISEFKNLAGEIDLSKTNLQSDVIDLSRVGDITGINLENTYASIKL